MPAGSLAAMTLVDPRARFSTAVVVVRPMRPRDREFTAALQQQALPHGFFARLGTPFLRAYHETFMASPHGIALVAETHDGPAGFVVGTFGPHSAWVLRNRWMTLVWRGALALLARPAELVFFLRTRTLSYARRLLRRSRSGPPVRRRRTKPPAVLTHVAVAPAARGNGVGEELVDAFLDAAEAAGAEQVCLVTLAGRDGAGRFYQRLGWDLDGVREDRDGRAIECYCWQL
jgi:GNAT superfamily N-acetyltransferase